MHFTPGHILAPLVMLLFLLCLYFLLDVIFIETYESRSKAFDADLRKIEEAMHRHDHEQAVQLAEELQRKAGDGVNDIRAQCLKGIALIRLRRQTQSVQVYSSLQNKYYGIRSVYTQWPESEEELHERYESILTTYVPGVVEATSNPVSFNNLFNALTLRRLVMIGGLMIGSIVLYDRIYKRRLVKNKNGR